MKPFYPYILILFFSWLGCRKDKPIPSSEYVCPPNIEEPIPPCIGDYNLYSNDTFSFIESNLISNGSQIGPFEYFPLPYHFSLPIVNPNNPYEFVYQKAQTDAVMPYELWKFSACTGQATKLADNQYYSLDWSSKGWILFTGTGHAIYKVKENGDSLTQLSTESGYNRAGRWSPSGNLYWNERDDGAYIKYADGSLYKKINTIPFGPKDWINDSTLLGWRDNNFYAMSINTESLTLLNNSWTPSIASYFLDRENMVCYVQSIDVNNHTRPFVKYDLKGSNTTDTIKINYESYNYGYGSFVNNQLLVGLLRIHWKDSANNEVYARRNIMLLNTDGTNERIINLPE